MSKKTPARTARKPHKKSSKPHARRKVKRVKTSPLLAVRKRKKMSRPALARKSGLSQECIRNIELRGASPQLRTLQTLAKALDVQITKLCA
jgi:DNA-binding XRE family transcriptional regulator